jgi:tetratricopeptide (TPR) repeat protein
MHDFGNDNEQTGEGSIRIAARALHQNDVAEAVKIYERGAASLVSAPPMVQWQFLTKAGTALFDHAEKVGPKAALDASVTFFERAITVAQQTPEADLPLTANLLGKSLLSLFPRDGNDEHISKANTSFETALKGWTKESNLAAWARVSINLASAHNQFKDPENKQARAEHALGILDQVIKILPAELQTDWSRAQETRGIILNSTGRTSEALEVYDTALTAAPDSRAKARILTRKSLALAEQGQANEAIAVVRQAQSMQKPHEYPLEYGLTLHTTADILTIQAKESAKTQDWQNFEEKMWEAKEYYESSLKFITRENSPKEWANATYNLAVTMGIVQMVRPDLPEFGQRSTELFEEAFPELPADKQAEIRQRRTEAAQAKSGHTSEA